MLARTKLVVLLLDLSRSKRREEQLSEELRERDIRLRSTREVRRAQILLRQRAVHVLLVVPGKRSPSAIRTLLESLLAIDEDIPIVILSDRPSVEEASESMRGRAYDYVAMDDIDALENALARAVAEKGFPLGPQEHLQRVLGERLRARRKERDLTLQQLAKRTNLSASLISQIELAKSQASVTTLQKLSRALHLPLMDLFRGF